ncbi:MAG: BatA domain-containing protein [Flavobacteriales bacterium]
MWGRPDILWGLLALAIPVALHLLQLRRFKRVAFSNVAFLRDVQKETRSRHRLRNLLILLARLLAFGCLILAFADPMLTPESKAGEAGRNAVSIYVDTSPSMMASGESAPLLQEAKGKANALVESFAETDLFHVFTSEFSGQDQRFLTRPEALERIASIQLSSQSPGLGSVVERSLDQLGRAEAASSRAFWISDVQESSHEVNTMTPPDSAVSWHLLPVQSNPSPNLWVDSVWFETPLALPDREAELHVRIGHDALDGVDGLPLQLRVDGVSEALGSFNVVPGMPTDTVLRFTHGAPGPHLVEVRIDDAPVSFDDVHHIGYDVSSGVKALHWSGGTLRDKTTQAVQQAFESSDGLVEVDWVQSLPTSPTLMGYDLLVVHAIDEPSLGAVSLVREFMSLGGTVMVLPDSMASGLSWVAGEASWVRGEGRVTDVQWSHPLFKPVFRSVPSRVDWPTYDRILDRRPRAQEEVLATAANGLPYLTRMASAEGGDLYLLGTCLETGNFVRHGLFVPTLLRVAESARHAAALAQRLDDAEALTIPRQPGRRRDHTWRIVGAEDVQVVPEPRSTAQGTSLRWGDALTEPGGYTVLRNDTAVTTFGLNHSPNESNLAIWDVEAWRERTASLGWPEVQIWTQPESQLRNLVEQHISGKRLAWYFFAAAMMALAFETLLLRRWNKLFS